MMRLANVLLVLFVRQGAFKSMILCFVEKNCKGCIFMHAIIVVIVVCVAFTTSCIKLMSLWFVEKVVKLFVV